MLRKAARKELTVRQDIKGKYTLVQEQISFFLAWKTARIAFAKPLVSPSGNGVVNKITGESG